MTSHLPAPNYPAAARLDIVEDLHGRPVADPYRWLEGSPIGDADQTADWLSSQAALFEDERAQWTMVDTFRDRITTLLSAGS